MNHILDMLSGLRAWSSAFQAGMIAHGCDDCVVDDEEECIYPCPVHADEIGRLAAENEEANV